MNNIIKDLLKKEHIAYWELGKKMNVSENTIWRLFHNPLSAETKAEIMDAVNIIKAERKTGNE